MLEGSKGLSDLLTNTEETIVGKKILNCNCPKCNAEDSMIISSVIDSDQNFYNVIAKCSECNENTEFEIVLKGEESPDISEESIKFSGRMFYPMFEGLMTGNYVKFNSNSKGFIIPNENGDNVISFDQPEEEENTKSLNSRVTFKIISFRNGFAKIISMVNDNFNKDKAGTIYFGKNERCS